jgi:hypothetical protein
MVMQILVENSVKAAFVEVKCTSCCQTELRRLRNMTSLTYCTLSGAGTENGRPCGLLSFTDPS